MKSLVKVGMLSLGVCLLFGMSLALPTTALAETHTVIVRNFAFAPQNIVIQKGDT
ncbi:MAG: hypothetical protein HKN21_07730, partial [Candidatus Eisenbacteria bacterium]|nr:hypothetical protein [Candidatus Eisenbacteria bacterium]